MPKALARAVASLAAPRILWLMVWPLIVSAALWAAVAAFAGPPLVARLAAWAASGNLPAWVPAAAITGVVGWLLVAVAWFALVIATTGVILGAFSMPIVVSHVAARDFPGLARRRGGSFAGSLWNGVAAFLLFAAAALVSLPLWVFPPLWPFLFVALFTLLNTRVFRYDALADHASAGEMREIFARDRGALYALGALTAALGLLPLVGFFSPVLGGLAFAQFGLARLAALRAKGGAT